jgi:hypothetical protein
MRRLLLLFLLSALVAGLACGDSSSDPLQGRRRTDIDSGIAPDASTTEGAAPAPDAASQDVAAPDGAAGIGCAGKSYKLCEDFESSAIGGTPTGWTVLDGYGSNPPQSVVANSKAHSGVHSLETSSSVAGASRVQKSFANLGATAGQHWGRVFFNVQSPAPQLPSQGPHATFVALQGNLRAGELRVVDTQQTTTGKIQLLANTPDDQCCTGTDFTYTIYDGAWHCAEWHVDSSSQSYRFFLDNTEITALKFDYGAGSTTANMPTAFSAVGLGTIFYTPTLPSPLVTWFDDLAIDDNQIGCN